MQIGMYATFSGLDEAGVAEYAARGLTVRAVPKTEGFEWDARQYRAAIDAANALRPDLVVIGGDMIDDPNSEDQYDEFMRITKLLDADIEMRWVPGNHDVATDTVVPTPESIAVYREAFGPDYYAFDRGPVRFVTLNTSVLDHPEHVGDELEAQFDFLEEELTRAAADDATVIIVGHHPLFLERADEPDDYWNLPTEQRTRVLDLVHRFGVPLFLAGHWHRNSLARDGAFEMVTSGPVGYPLGSDPSGIRLVEVGDGRISHEYRPL